LFLSFFIFPQKSALILRLFLKIQLYISLYGKISIELTFEIFLDKILETIYSENVTLTADLLLGLGDTSAFT